MRRKVERSQSLVQQELVSIRVPKGTYVWMVKEAINFHARVSQIGLKNLAPSKYKREDLSFKEKVSDDGEREALRQAASFKKQSKIEDFLRRIAQHTWHLGTHLNSSKKVSPLKGSSWKICTFFPDQLVAIMRISLYLNFCE